MMITPPDRWKRIEALFAEALECSAEERAALLERACSEDPALRTSLDRLLRAHESAGGFLQELDAARTAALVEESGRVDETLGRYRVLRRLGQGGMGIVYLAHDERLDRRVALKLLPPYLSAGEQAKRRLTQEAKAASALDHPHIATVYEIDETDDERLFLVMAYYEGETLRERIARGALPVEEAVRIAAQLADALAAAHAAGIVHRDIKPANVILNSRGAAKVLDFGIAKVAGSALTQTGATPGTVAYMSPEQTRGEAADPRTDLWSLGVVLYEILTGQRPFRAENEQALIYSIRHDAPPPIRELRPEVPEGLARVVERCLAKEVDARPADAAALLGELRSLAVSLPPPLAKPARWRAGIRYGSLAGLFVLLVTGGVALRPRMQPADPVLKPIAEADRATPIRLAVLPLANFSPDPADEYFADGLTEELISRLSRLRDLRVIARTSVMPYKDTGKSIAEIAGELQVGSVLEGSVRKAGERVRITMQLVDARSQEHLWSEDYDTELADVLAVQSEIAQQIARALQAELSPSERAGLARRPTANPIAHDYVLRAREYLRTTGNRQGDVALSLLRKARELDPEYPDALAALSSAYRYQNRVSAPEEYRVWLDSAVVAARHAIALDPEFAQAYAELGWALDYRGDRDAALEAHLRAVELNSNLSDGLANLYQYGFGRMDDAVRWWRPALEADPTNAIVIWLAGRSYLHLGMPARAQPLLEKAIAFQPEFLWSYYTLSLTFLLEGRPEEARAQIQRVIAAAHQDPEEAFIIAGLVEVALGDLAQARRYFTQADAAIRDLPVSPQPAFLLAWMLQQSGDTERARELVQRAVSNLENRWGGRPRRPGDYVDLARVRVLEGDRQGALQAFEEGVRRGWRFYNEYPNDPILNSLRGEPRYDRLMAEVKADVARQRARVEREGW